MTDERRAGSARIALVTCRQALDLDEDLAPLRAALEARGARVSTPRWDDPAVDWSACDLAVLRSTWDYAERVGEFLSWTERCAASTMLLNPPEVVRWNTDKHYLRELATAGVPVVPTRFVEPGADAHHALSRFLAAEDDAVGIGCCDRFEEFVVKPTVGAGTRDAARYRYTEVLQARSHLERLLGAGRSVMLQPYLDRVDAHGETAVIYIDGVASHAIRKGPLLRSGAGLVEGLFAPEVITPREESPAERSVAAAAHAALPFARLLYARIDLVHERNGAPVVLEVELTEPSLFFAHAPASAGRFAAALLARLEVDP
jgi:glutathione synthase/RimK-type ligase-like ATP-grasp enzyme